MNTSIDEPREPVSGDRFRDAMATFPTGVTITTTIDADGRWWGFTASSFCSLSADPPLVLVCLAKSAECHSAFMTGTSFAVHIVQSDRADLAKVFATRGADKFAASPFELSARGLPVMTEAAAVLECSVHARYDGGDHTILIGRVDDVVLGDRDAVVYYQRDFRRMPIGPEGDVEMPQSG